MLNDIEYILLDEKQIDEITSKLAAQITEDYKDSKKKLVLICILKGSLPFTCDLMRKISLPMELEFMKVSSYGSGTISSGVLRHT